MWRPSGLQHEATSPAEPSSILQCHSGCSKDHTCMCNTHKCRTGTDQHTDHAEHSSPHGGSCQISHEEGLGPACSTKPHGCVTSLCSVSVYSLCQPYKLLQGDFTAISTASQTHDVQLATQLSVNTSCYGILFGYKLRISKCFLILKVLKPSELL